MKMKFILMISMIILTACNGGDSGGNGTGSGVYTHKELAERFVYNLNLSDDFAVKLMKDSTEQRDFIVIYDPYTDTYDAINISGYNVNSSATDFYYSASTQFYGDLDVIPSYDSPSGWVETQYRDHKTDLYFEKVSASAKDLAKVAALKEVIELDKSAEFLSSEFGLSLDRSKEIARLATHWKKASKKAMTNAEQDSFSTELLGFSITDGKQVIKEASEGNLSGLSELVEAAALKNSISPEHASRLMTKLFDL